MTRKLSILGSTGSIGTQALDVVRRFPDAFKIIGLSAGKNVSALLPQIREFRPQWVAISDETVRVDLQSILKTEGIACTVFCGNEGLEHVASEGHLDMLLVSIVGTAALLPTVAAIKKGIPIALASKEVLVAAGPQVCALAHAHGVPILPVDSEHAAIHQCMGQYHTPDIEKIILTASGGPFWNRTIDTFPAITRAEALRHPNWEMGSKITIDSATMMNKGLEVIEAHFLFGLPYDQIQVLIHPQSVVHGLVQFHDGNLIAHLGPPDMRYPIQYALTHPAKQPNTWPRADLTKTPLHFSPPDFDKFPCLKLAYAAGRQGGAFPAVLNAANEAAVGLFLEEKIGFNDIAPLVETQLEQASNASQLSIPDIVALDRQVKAAVRATTATPQ